MADDDLDDFTAQLNKADDASAETAGGPAGLPPGMSPEQAAAMKAA